MNGCYDNCGCQCGNSSCNGNNTLIWIIIAIVVIVWLGGWGGSFGNNGCC